ncbi:RNA dependent RNA polymerase [Niallia taxi]|uniref:RNA dependent RNA polymerase n=1 Tax=Niallia taxi TaxID=2499688 RepID=UPI003008BD14
MTTNKQVYILSLEASDIYSHIHRETPITYDYCGMLPFSLELIKLRNEGLKTKLIKHRDKEISNDIINVKFKQRVKSGSEIKEMLLMKIEENESNDEYCKKLNSFINLITDDTENEHWDSVNVNTLREILYTKGFSLRSVNKNTGEINYTEYVVYKRSSAKSRTGQCLFIKKSLYNKMIKWSRMGLPIKQDMEIDLAGLLAYESLVGSSLEDIININPERILLVDDMNSNFFRTANVVKKGKNGLLDSFKEKTKISNSLFDGESLLDSKYFKKGVAMNLLRNHMFKSAAFNCNIQQFLKDNCPPDSNYDDWELTDMFNNPILAKDVDLICTPTSLKALKFSNIIGTDKDMWAYWKLKVQEDGNLFGVCKHDKKSKLGVDGMGKVLQQTSYQMINCLPITTQDIPDLVRTEKEYIERLKNDDEFFISKLKDSSTLMNSNEMFVTIFNSNEDIINTKIFRDFRKGFIKTHVNHSKKGKIKLNGDYCVMLGNPIEFLKHAIGKFTVDDNDQLTLKDNEVYTTLFDFDKEYVGFRNPNTSPSNVLVAKNTYVQYIEKYFNLTDNIVCVNAIDFPLQDILSGSDYDSDTVLLFNDEKMLELAKQCFGKYPVCVNHVEGQKKTYKFNKLDMYEIDNQLSTSQRNIGKVVNLGQYCMSTFWDLINKGQYGEHVDELLKKVDVMTILSGISIDMAKKFYEIDINKEIKHVEKNDILKARRKKPNFWKYVSQSKTINNRITHYDCPMDFLIEELDLIKQASRKESLCFESLLIERDSEKVNYKQFDKITSLVRELDNAIKNEYAKHNDKEETNIIVENIMKDYIIQVKRLKINVHTMQAIVRLVIDTESKLILRLLNVLYNSHKETFVNLFKCK